MGLFVPIARYIYEFHYSNSLRSEPEINMQCSSQLAVLFILLAVQWDWFTQSVSVHSEVYVC